jgi:multidrug transporter EmrE-like cation transporter
MQLVLSVLAALCFTLGGVFMKYADGLRNLGAVAGFMALFAIGASLQSIAMRTGGLGTTYVVILGLEAALAFGLGIMLFSEGVTWLKCFAVLLILAGIILIDQ